MIDKSMDALVWLRKQLETGDNDLLREMVRSFAEGLMGAELTHFLPNQYQTAQDSIKLIKAKEV